MPFSVLGYEQSTEEEKEMKKCLFIDTCFGNAGIPASRPMAYCYAKNEKECPKKEWIIDEKCWRKE